MDSLATSCIYTIVKAEKLEEAFGSQKALTSTEGRRWVSGLRIWQEAASSGLQVPVVFADAADCSELTHWGILEDIRLDENHTHYRACNIRRLSKRHTPQDLVLKSSGANIAPNFIRPYAICRTPGFLRD